MERTRKTFSQIFASSSVTSAPRRGKRSTVNGWTPSLRERLLVLAKTTLWIALLLSAVSTRAAPETPPTESPPATAAGLTDCGDWNTHAFFEVATPGDVRDCLALGTSPHARGPNGTAPLHRAARRSRSPEVIEILVAAGADPHAETDSGSVPLSMAACNPEPVAATALLQAGADPTVPGGPFGMTPLHYAVVCDNSAVVRTLVEAGADPNAPDNWGWTPLHCAGHCPREVREYDYAVHRGVAVTEALIAVGADVGVRTGLGDTPLHHAARGNTNTAVIEVLIDAGAEPNARNEDGRTPLHTAARFNDAGVVAALIDAGADPAARDSLFGGTPLHNVLRDPRNAEVLLAAGASHATTDRRGRTPLHTVAGRMIWEQGVEVMRTMIAHGALLDSRDDDGYAPLHVAATSVAAYRAAAVEALVHVEAALVAPNGNTGTNRAGEVVTARTTLAGPGGSDDLWAVGYFDEDRAADAAFFRRLPVGTYELVASLSTRTGSVVLAELPDLTDMGVRTLDPGTYMTACAKGAGPQCPRDDDGPVVLNRDGILLFRHESAARLLHLVNGAFVSVWLSD